MGVWAGLPDFGRPVRAGAVSGFAAYEQPDVVAALPTGLSAAAVEGATAPLSIDVYLQERTDGSVQEYGLVTAGFTLDVPLDAAQRDDPPGRVVRPAPLTGGVLRLVAPDRLDVPAAALLPRPFDAAAGRVLPILVRLDAVATELLVGSLRAGLLALGAVAWVSVRGLATRCPGELSVDVDELLAALGPGPVTPADLTDRAAEGLPGVTVVDGPDDTRLLGAAVVERVVTRLATVAVEEDGGWRFSADAPQTTLTWDLAQPTVGHRLLRLTSDPVVALSPDPDEGAGMVRRHTVPRLTDGRERIVVHSTLPAVPGGVVTSMVRLVAPPVPPDRPFAAEVTATLAPPAPVPVTLVLAPGERLVYDLTGTAVLDTDLGPRAAVGPTRRVDDDPTPVVTPRDLGLRLVPVDATQELLDVADVSVTARATWSGTGVASRVELGPGTGRAWLALPRDGTDVSIDVCATARAASGGRVCQAVPDAAVWLDLFSFEDPPWPLPGEPVDVPVVVEAADLRVVGSRGGPDWRFLPLSAGPVRDQSGAPQLNLLLVPGSAMLMVTTALRVSDEQQALARTACLAAGAPRDVRLSPAPFEAEESALLVLRDGTLTALAAVTSSGTTTQDASFGVSLDDADLQTVQRALAGEVGLLVARYRLRVAATGPPAAALGGPDPVTVLSDASTWRA